MALYLHMQDLFALIDLRTRSNGLTLTDLPKINTVLHLVSRNSVPSLKNIGKTVHELYIYTGIVDSLTAIYCILAYLCRKIVLFTSDEWDPNQGYIIKYNRTT